MSKLSEKPWGEVDKDELLKYVIKNPKKAKDIYLKIEPNWEEDPSNRLSYPIADKTGTIYRYALSSALTYAKANNETQVINKLKKMYKQYNLVEEFNIRPVIEAYISESVSIDDLSDIAKSNLKKELGNSPDINRKSDSIEFQLDGYDAKKISKVKVKNWYKSLDSKVFVYREQGNHWGQKQDYFDYTVSLKNLSQM